MLCMVLLTAPVLFYVGCGNLAQCESKNGLVLVASA